VQLIAHLKTLSFSPSSLPPPTINFIFLSSLKYGTLPPPTLSSSTSSSLPPSDEYLHTSTPILSSYRSVCEIAYPGCRISVVGGVREAIGVARGLGKEEGKGKEGNILVTGHMVLVGEVLEEFRKEGLLDGL
jgi:hypothetical protein